MQKNKFFQAHFLTAIAIGGAIGFLLMFLEFSLPFAPEFIKLDISDLPALVLSFAYGPVAGVFTELIKNLLHLIVGKTLGIGELSNFLLGCAFVVPAGLIYKHNKTRRGALIAMLTGTLCFSAMGMLTNYFIMFPFYSSVFGIPMDAIIAMCQKILPFADSTWKVILFSVTPFNLLKGILVSAITFLIYKRISPLLKPKKNN